MESSASTFWSGRRVLITGHTGFIGGWLWMILEALGAELKGYSLLPSDSPNLFQAARIDEGLGRSTIGDIRNIDLLNQVIEGYLPEVVIHLAAQPIVFLSYQDPVETYSVNVMGLVTLLEAVRKVKSIKSVIVVTSDKCYENNGLKKPFSEGDPMGGHDPYSSSKGCAELVCAAYRRSFLDTEGKLLATVRAGNVIGGGDWGRYRLVPDMVCAFSKGEPVQIRRPHAVRPWQHVMDPIRGMMTLAQRLYEGDKDCADAFNLGPGEECLTTVRELVQTATIIWSDGATWLEGAPGDLQHEATRLTLDCRKAEELLSWRPALDLRTAIQWTIDWYRAYYAGTHDMKAFSIVQATNYFKMMVNQ